MQSEGKRDAAFSRLRRTDMLKFLTSAIGIIFLIGLVSEQITALTYRRDV